MKEKKITILAASAFWAVNKDLARHLKSNDAVVMLAELVYKHDYWKARGKLDPEDGFFVKGSDLEKDTNINKRQRLKLTKVLTGLGLITVRRKGATARNWYRIQFPEILAMLNTLNQSLGSKNQKLSWSESAPINNNKALRNTIELEKTSVASLQPREEKFKKIKKDPNVQVPFLVQDTFLKVEMIDQVCQRYLVQHPEHACIVQQMTYIIQYDKSSSSDYRFPDNNELCLHQLDKLIRGRGLSQKEIANIERIYEKNVEHQERLASWDYSNKNRRT